jgi:hypothetical protein
MQSIKISKKVTVAALGLPKDTIQAMIADWAPGQEGDVATIYGTASKVAFNPSKLDPTKVDAKFVGAFEGFNMLTGETVVGATAYLPGAMADTLANAIESGDGPVEFACVIGVRKVLAGEKSLVGYTFTVRVDRDPQEADPLAAVRQRAIASLDTAQETLALPAPTKKGKKSA